MSTSTHPRDAFVALWRDLAALESAQQLLEWDQETYMPGGGAEARSRALAALAGVVHDRLTDPRLAELTAACAETAGDDEVWQGQVREARRRIDRATRVPRRLVAELAAATSTALGRWEAARDQQSFAVFAPALQRVLDLKREEAGCLGGDRPYDALLDQYEPGATEAELAPLFDALGTRLSALVQEVAATGLRPDPSAALGDFPLEAQRRSGEWVAGEIGFDFTAGRLDPTTHPFCLGLDRRDVRITWRGERGDLRPALFGILHEAGHGLYEQGLPEELAGTPAGAAASHGVHESQSRLWENAVGRSHAFWRWLGPRLGDQLGGHRVDADAMWPALHAVRPSFIRVEADEATYNLHIVVRFELERALFAGRLELAELPVAWDDLYESVLGIRPGKPTEGVLQDVHWAAGLFGYFPTYTLGTLLSVQLFDAAADQLGDVDEQLAAGDFAPLLTWLRERVHHRGAVLTPEDLIQEATGGPLSAEPFLAYLGDVCESVYGVRPGAARPAAAEG